VTIAGGMAEDVDHAIKQAGGVGAVLPFAPRRIYPRFVRKYW